MRGNDFFDLDRHLLIRSIIHSRVICWCHRLILVVHLNRVFTVFYHISCTHTLCFNLYRESFIYSSKYIDFSHAFLFFVHVFLVAGR